MCGRTACTLAPDEFSKACRFKGKNGKVQEPTWRDAASGGKYYPSYNISPQSFTPVLLSSQHFNTAASEVTSERVLQPMRWGLIPSWHRGDPKEFSYNMSNARSDTLLDKRSFKSPLEKGKRCVILAEGFFEWETLKGGKKQPYYIYFKKDAKAKVKQEETSTQQGGNPQIKEEASPHEPDVKSVKIKDEPVTLSKVKEEATVCCEDRRLLTMAGLFDCWQAPKGSANEGEELFSYTIITVDSCSSLNWLHNRMPAILDGEEEVCQWLEYGKVPWQKALDLVTPKDCLEWYPVSTIVNNSRNKSPECIKPIDLEASFWNTVFILQKITQKRGESAK
ncbi:abasic site processing protein HMCES-like isoform X2 [Oculina patagonica]